MLVGLTTMEVSEGELVQLAIGRATPISISAFNKERSNIDDLQEFRRAPAPPFGGKVADSFPPLIVYPKVANPPNRKKRLSLSESRR
jgi:hypothetical protein